MRDTLSNICTELMSDMLPFMRPTANNRSNLEPDTDCYQLNERATDSINLTKLTFLGYFMGWSLANIGSLNLDLPMAFWARLCGGLDYVYTLDDLRSQDILLMKNLESIRTAATEKTDQEYDMLYGD